jgi:hypothetical protein
MRLLYMRVIGCEGPPTPIKIRMFNTLVAAPHCERTAALAGTKLIRATLGRSKIRARWQRGGGAIKAEDRDMVRRALADREHRPGRRQPFAVHKCAL